MWRASSPPPGLRPGPGYQAPLSPTSGLYYGINADGTPVSPTRVPGARRRSPRRQQAAPSQPTVARPRVRPPPGSRVRAVWGLRPRLRSRTPPASSSLPEPSATPELRPLELELPFQIPTLRLGLPRGLDRIPGMRSLPEFTPNQITLPLRPSQPTRHIQHPMHMPPPGLAMSSGLPSAYAPTPAAGNASMRPNITITATFPSRAALYEARESFARLRRARSHFLNRLESRSRAGSRSRDRRGAMGSSGSQRSNSSRRAATAPSITQFFSVPARGSIRPSGPQSFNSPVRGGTGSSSSQSSNSIRRSTPESDSSYELNSSSSEASLDSSPGSSPGSSPEPSPHPGRGTRASTTKPRPELPHFGRDPSPPAIFMAHIMQRTYELTLQSSTVSWNWKGSHPSGTAAEVKPGDVTVTSHRGNDITKTGTKDDPAVHIERSGNDVVKTVSELKVDQKSSNQEAETSNGAPSSSVTNHESPKAESEKQENGVSANGTDNKSEEAQAGEKRKADEKASAKDAAEVPSEENDTKKQKTTGAAEATAAANGKKRPGRPKGGAKKERKEPRAGLAARKTRSQGKAE